MFSPPAHHHRRRPHHHRHHRTPAPQATASSSHHRQNQDTEGVNVRSDLFIPAITLTSCRTILNLQDECAKKGYTPPPEAKTREVDRVRFPSIIAMTLTNCRKRRIVGRDLDAGRVCKQNLAQPPPAPSWHQDPTRTRTHPDRSRPNRLCGRYTISREKTREKIAPIQGSAFPLLTDCRENISKSRSRTLSDTRHYYYQQ